MTQTVINPATGETEREYEEMTPKEAGEAVGKAHRAFEAWRRTDFGDRAELMRGAARILREREEAWASLMTREMGKPIAGARSEVEKCAWVCDYYADHAADFLAPEPAGTDASRSYVAFEPVGTILAIMPWNFPFWQVFRFAAPTLMAGNAGILKHAPNVPGCALAIEEIFREAGFPEDLFRTLLVPVEHAGAIIEDSRIRAVTLTGSTRAGKAVAEHAGSLVKKTVLELGGSDPYLVLEDAPLDETVEACVTSRLINGGQSCIAAKRFIVVEPRVEEFTERVVERMGAARMGDPTDEATVVGPQAREDLRDALHDQVVRSVDAGARCLLGGEVPDRPGFYYPPTVLAGVKPGMAAWDEELFGPVATIIAADGEEDAIRIANGTQFGLGAAVFTADDERGERIARDELDAGCCFVNAFVRSDPRLPFGGVKKSGYGRELGSFGIREFVNVKTVWVA